MSLKQKIIHHLINLPGWHTNRKIVVIESDDWGSIRMPSKEVYDKLLKKGIRVDNMPYNRYDSLASEKDLEALFEVLTSVKDKNGNPAVITANTIVANPDFDKIKGSGFQEYFYEPFTETLKRYPKHGNSFNLWKEGIEKKVFIPQFHGREHLNVIRWLRSLQKDIGNVQLAFDYRMFDLTTGDNLFSENSFMDALNYEDENELNFQKNYIIDGLSLFNSIFNFRSLTFIAPMHIWSEEHNNVLFNEGVLGLQGSWYQRVPTAGKEQKFKKKFHYTGQKNKIGQRYLVRNAAFEPSQNEDFDWIDDVLKRASIIFRCKKPLIIESHRLNFIGFIHEENRNKNLKLLKTLLKELLKSWPDIIFVSSDELLKLIIKVE